MKVLGEKSIKIENIKEQKHLERIIKFIVGCFIVSVSYNLFLAPKDLVPGGVSGIATILNKCFGLNNSFIILLINVFLLIISFILLGKEKTKATTFGALLYPLFVRMTENVNVWLQIDTSQVLLATICGGVIYGVGVGLIFKAGFTTGGTDIISHIMSKYLKIGIGKSILIVDGTIVLISGIFFGVNTMMYSILVLYIISMMSDRVLLGISDSKAFFIVTSKKSVKDFITYELNQKVSDIEAIGGYENKKQNVLMTVLPTKEYYKLKEGIKRLDSKAFYIITDTYEVFGGK